MEKSYEILDRLTAHGSRTTRKYISAMLGHVSDREWFDKQCRPQATDDNPTATGRRNFLDNVALVMHCFTESGEPEKARELADWVARRAGGIFVPTVTVGDTPEDAQRALMDAYREFGAVLEESAEAFRDGLLTPVEAARIIRANRKHEQALLAYTAAVERAAKKA